ncbi:PqqD family peptide modification chaperone [Roseomonas populi]|uniref:PqqD family peptide modification chaperone n=1 Tax=Roseomonas populi TaxID=3121582 RepID=A0ABT1X5R9_9PROT|nr:PqqD family peptide modification chaperone [Roseomonas pecuniae]MCR0982743.1 PqqD family peptide modification chaperone [Roseomonas pecuniae]
MRHERSPGLRLRPLPELGACLAYTPAAPRLHQLNATAWLILELADGRDDAALAEAFAARTAKALSATAARRTLEDGLAGLRACGLLRVAGLDREERDPA